MKIKDILSGDGVSVSLEIFPPKKEENLERTREVVRRLCLRKPAFVSVTCGAASTRDAHTADVAAFVASRGVTALAHMTCAATPAAAIREQLSRLRSLGVENVLALRGDLPPGATSPGEGRLEHACDLIREIKAAGDFCVGAACYPEKHPESADSVEDMLMLKRKVDDGADFLTTQMFFDNSLFYRFLWKAREIGITVPIVAGIMPITSGTQVERARTLSGSTMPPRFLSIVDKWGANPAAMEQAGVAYATGQIVDLLANGVRAIHIYTMNKPSVAEAIMDNLSELVGPALGASATPSRAQT